MSTHKGPLAKLTLTATHVGQEGGCLEMYAQIPETEPQKCLEARVHTSVAQAFFEEAKNPHGN